MIMLIFKDVISYFQFHIDNNVTRSICYMYSGSKTGVWMHSLFCTSKHKLQSNINFINIKFVLV